MCYIQNNQKLKIKKKPKLLISGLQLRTWKIAYNRGGLTVQCGVMSIVCMLDRPSSKKTSQD